MNATVRRPVRLPGSEDAQLDHFFGAGTMRDRLGTSEPELNLLINKLEDYVNGTILQHHRIAHNYQVRARLMFENLENVADRSISESLFSMQDILFLDIHFYAICVDKVDKLCRKLLEHIAPMAKAAPNTREIRAKRKEARVLLDFTSEPVTKARDWLEHVDEKIAHGDFSGLHSARDDIGLTFSYGAEPKRTIDISSDPIARAYEAVLAYIRSLPPISI
jgi:hypothetical protein